MCSTKYGLHSFRSFIHTVFSYYFLVVTRSIFVTESKKFIGVLLTHKSIPFKISLVRQKLSNYNKMSVKKVK